MNEAQRQTLIDMITSHEIYDTMSSWNGLKSYSRNVKIYRLTIPKELIQIAYGLVGDEWVYDSLNFIIQDFEERNDHYYTIGFNGRSGGHLVLYEQYKENIKNPYKSRCNKCRKFTWYEPEQKCKVCNGGILKKYTSPKFKYTTSSKTLIKDEDELKAMNDEDLMEWVCLILDFNLTIDDMIERFIECCGEHKEQQEVVDG